jgi:hypothetical protein
MRNERPLQERNYEYFYALMTDEELEKSTVAWNEEQTGAWETEVRKRKKAKDQEKITKEQEQARLETERIERSKQRKETLTYNDALAQEICERVSAGELLILICDEENMPTVRKAYQWLKEHTEFQQLYNASIQDRLSIFEEQIIAISDDVSRDFKTIIKKGGATKRVPDPDQVARARLRVETRIKYLRAFKPQRWAEQSTLNLKSADEFDPSNFSAEDLESEIAQIEAKSRPARAA